MHTPLLVKLWLITSTKMPYLRVVVGVKQGSSRYYTSRTAVGPFTELGGQHLVADYLLGRSFATGTLSYSRSHGPELDHLGKVACDEARFKARPSCKERKLSNGRLPALKFCPHIRLEVRTWLFGNARSSCSDGHA